MGNSGKFVFRNKLLQAVAGVTALMAAGLTQAAEGESAVTPLLQEAVKNTEFSGFLSIRGGAIDDEDLIYANRYRDEWTFSQESVFGLQLNSKASEHVNVSMQMTATSGDDPVELEWAYLEYVFSVDTSARFGRLRAPGFMLSEFLDVGYAYPWVQTPYEVYGWLPFSRYEGMDLRHQLRLGDTDVRLNPYLGTTAGKGLSIGDVEFADQTSRFAGLDVQATYDILTVRAGYSKYKFELSNARWDQFIGQIVDGKIYVPEIGNDLVTFVEGVELPGFVDFVDTVMIDGILEQLVNNPGLLPLFGLDVTVDELIAEQASLAAQLPAYQSIPRMSGKSDGSFAGVGFSLDNGEYLLMSELSRSQIDGVFPDVDSGYVMFGYRFGAWMPNITFAKMYTTDEDEREPVRDLQLNPEIWYANEQLAQVAAGAAVYSGVLATTTDLVRLEQECITVGLRWDPAPGIAVKGELLYIELLNDSYGFALPGSIVDVSGSQEASLGNVDIPEPPNSVKGLRMSIDAVF